MIFGSALLLIGGLAAAEDVPFVEDAYTEIEARLDSAQSSLVEAGTYVCRDRYARSAFSVARGRYEAIEADARKVLGRQLNLKIWTNSCGAEGDGPTFRSLLIAADAALHRAAALIRKERERR